ncbi:MAG TPA: 5-methyltetrahydrofolate--homocysteine methyltransferase [Candidatus Cloacimonetes bacterium]|nr:5-methyltetrahydrofolate--homocysteine methyltransferase [Candidatus Cloacimonadota bacterium]
MENMLTELTNKILVGDGAMGTMLFQKGLKQGDAPETVCLNNPEVLEEIAKIYLDAGADIIETNTFGGSPLKLSDYNLQDKTGEINRIAVERVRKAVGEEAYISGSVGPSGKMLKPFGDADPEDIYQSFRRQIKVLIESGIDIICIETMIDLNEAILAIKAVKSISQKIPIITTMTFNETPRGFFTIMGNDIETVSEKLEENRADIIGSNCGNGIENMIKIAHEFKKYTKLPIIIQSNAGLPELKKGKIFYSETPEFFAEKTMELIAAGVSIIGGCCGTTPKHIQAIRKVVDNHI